MEPGNLSHPVLAVLLAAGGGSRFAGSGHKLLAEVRGRPVLVWAVEAVRSTGLEVVVISGAVELPPLGVEVVHNPRWAQGQATSLQEAVRQGIHRGAEAIVVGLGDQPFVPPEAWAAVAATDAPVAVAT